MGAAFPLSWARALAFLSPLQRELILALGRGDDETADDLLAARFGTTPHSIRAERFEARRRLREAIEDRNASDS